MGESEAVGVIVLADDDPSIGELVTRVLQEHGFIVHCVSRGDLVEQAVSDHEPDLVILDVMMPGATGLQVCTALRARRPALPILLMTGLADEVDEIVGLEVGADDYLVKPVSPRLLLARVRTQLRRATPAGPGGRLRVGRLEIAFGARRATLDGEPLGLNDTEFELLALLARSAGEVLDRETLYRDLRGIRWDGLDRSMDQRVSRLRARLGPGARDLIRAVRGVGYQLVKE